jgi:hypothetical protein
MATKATPDTTVKMPCADDISLRLTKQPNAMTGNKQMGK